MKRIKRHGHELLFLVPTNCSDSCDRDFFVPPSERPTPLPKPGEVFSFAVLHQGSRSVAADLLPAALAKPDTATLSDYLTDKDKNFLQPPLKRAPWWRPRSPSCAPNGVQASTADPHGLP